LNSITEDLFRHSIIEFRYSIFSRRGCHEAHTSVFFQSLEFNVSAKLKKIIQKFRTYSTVMYYGRL
jgi:hypothetical protein